VNLLSIVPLWARIAALVAFAAALMLFGFVGGIHHEEAKEAARVIKKQQADLKAMADAAAKTKSLQHAKDEAINAANERAKYAEAAASAAHAVGDSLRHDLTDAERVSRASIASLRAYTTTIRSVFGECTAEVERLAGKAQGHASDTLTLEQAWPN
jgi:methylthioribose-1-phosphate isomerase